MQHVKSWKVKVDHCFLKFALYKSSFVVNRKFWSRVVNQSLWTKVVHNKVVNNCLKKILWKKVLNICYYYILICYRGRDELRLSPLSPASKYMKYSKNAVIKKKVVFSSIWLFPNILENIKIQSCLVIANYLQLMVYNQRHLEPKR